MIAAYPDRYVTAQDIAQAWELANDAEAQAGAAWDRVELATREAERLETKAATLRERAQRVKCQLGFRRPAGGQ